MPTDVHPSQTSPQFLLIQITISPSPALASIPSCSKSRDGGGGGNQVGRRHVPQSGSRSGTTDWNLGARIACRSCRRLMRRIIMPV